MLTMFKMVTAHFGVACHCVAFQVKEALPFLVMFTVGA